MLIKPRFGSSFRRLGLVPAAHSFRAATSEHTTPRRNPVMRPHSLRGRNAIPKFNVRQKSTGNFHACTLALYHILLLLSTQNKHLFVYFNGIFCRYIIAICEWICYNNVIKNLEYNMAFGEKVKSARLQLFLSQEKLAKELGVSFATINRWERGLCEPNYDGQKAFHDFCEKNHVNFEK